jgi:hypothetical protein
MQINHNSRKEQYLKIKNNRERSLTEYVANFVNAMAVALPRALFRVKFEYSIVDNWIRCRVAST